MSRLRSPAFWAALLLALVIGFAVAIVQIDREARKDPRLIAFVPTGLGGISDELRGRAALRSSPETAGTYVESVLIRRPIDVSHLSSFALWAAQRGDMALAGQVLTEAAQRGWRDAYVQLSVLASAAQAGDLTSATQRFDALSRAEVEPAVLVSVLDSMLKLEGGDKAVVPQIIASDHLKDTLVDFVRGRPRSGEALNRLTRAMAASGYRLDCERRSLLTRALLLQGDPYANDIWGKDCGGVASDDLGFVFPAQDKRPFAWTYDTESGVYARPGRASGSASFSNRDLVQKVAAIRFLALPQGKHAIEISRARHDGSTFGDSGAAPLNIAVTCLGDGRSKMDRLLGQAEDAGRLLFTVPENCGTQQLRVRVGRGKVDDLRLKLLNI